VPSAVRRAELRAAYYFDCDCARCHAADREDSQLNAVLCTASSCTGGLCLPVTAATAVETATFNAASSSSSSSGAACSSSDVVAQQQREQFRQWSCMQSTVQQPSNAAPPTTAAAAGSVDDNAAVAYMCDR
jgi:hypothetical protein